MKMMIHITRKCRLTIYDDDTYWHKNSYLIFFCHRTWFFLSAALYFPGEWESSLSSVIASILFTWYEHFMLQVYYLLLWWIFLSIVWLTDERIKGWFIHSLYVGIFSWLWILQMCFSPLQDFSLNFPKLGSTDKKRNKE